MAFKYRKSLSSKEQPQLQYFIIDNSVSISLGDAVKVDGNGHALLATAGDAVAGIVHQVVDKEKAPIDPDTNTLDTYTVASDNETVAQKKVAIDMSKDSLYFNDANGSLAEGNRLDFFNLTSESQIDQGTASANNGQFQLIEIDPDGDGDASKGLFKIAESMLDPYTQD